MSYTNLEELKDVLGYVATQRGMTPTNPVSVSINNASTQFKFVRFVVSHVEPDWDTTPLNVLWFVKDPNNSDLDKLLVRGARTPSSPYNHTWSEVTQLSAVYNEQIWDLPKPENQALYDHISSISDPHALQPLTESGGTLTGPLNTRTLGEGEEPGAQEAVPRTWVDAAIGEMQSITESIVQFFSNLNSQLDNLRSRVEILELLLKGVKGFVYSNETAEQQWSIAHNMNNSNVTVQVFEGNQAIWPASIEIVDANNVMVEFAEPVKGKAEIIPIVQLP